MNLAEAKVGDYLLVRRGPLSGHSVRRVERVTKTQVIDSNGGRWRISNGRKVGHRSSGVGALHRACVATEGDIERVARKDAIFRIRRLSERDLSGASLTTLRAAVEALEACRAEVSDDQA